MKNTKNFFERFFLPREEIPAGIYHYQSPPEDSRNYRLHLRLEQSGDGILIVNAATILHLNKTAAAYAYYLVNNTNPDEVARKMAAKYQVAPSLARQDYLDLAERVQTLIETPDLDPVTFLDFERQQPFSGRLSAPYRLDCALTYRLRNPVIDEAVPVDRVKRELSTDEWKRILNKAWDAGIPHIIFTGGEPTLRDDLVELVIHAEDLGQVSGLLTDGLIFTNRAELDRYLQAGLDHLMIILHPDDENSWVALGNALAEDISVVAHLTITPNNQGLISGYLDRLAETDVQKISLSAIDKTLQKPLQLARELAAAHNLELVWNIPVPYSELHPIAMEIDDAAIEGAGRAWLYVEPDGDVCPTQGNPIVLGNLLNDPWRKVWRGGAVVR